MNSNPSNCKECREKNFSCIAFHRTPRVLVAGNSLFSKSISEALSSSLMSEITSTSLDTHFRMNVGTSLVALFSQLPPCFFSFINRECWRHEVIHVAVFQDCFSCQWVSLHISFCLFLPNKLNAKWAITFSKNKPFEIRTPWGNHHSLSSYTKICSVACQLVWELVDGTFESHPQLRQMIPSLTLLTCPQCHFAT